MKTITAATIVFTLFSTTVTTADACGPAGTPGRSVPPTQAQTSTLAPGCRTTRDGRTNCFTYAGSVVNPGRVQNQYMPGYISPDESRQGLKYWKSFRPGERIGPFRTPHMGVAGTHAIVIHPDGSVSQRFDTDPGRYQNNFNNIDGFRNQRPGWRQGTPNEMPYSNAVVDVYCGPNCREH